MDWPGFPDQVVRASSEARHQEARVEARRSERRDEPSLDIQLTSDSISAAITRAVRSSDKKERRHAYRALHELGPAAAEPLVEIVERPTDPGREVDTAIRLLIQTAGDRHDAPWPIELREMSPFAGRAFDAITRYAIRNPDERSVLHQLVRITPIQKLEALITLMPDALPNHQAAYIATFNAITHHRFPMLAGTYRGNTSPVAVQRILDDSLARQRAAVLEIQSWWEQHKHEPYEAWAIAAVERHVADMPARIASRIDNYDVADAYGLQQRNFQLRQYDSYAYGLRFGPAVYQTLVAAFDSAREHVRPSLLHMIALTRHQQAASFARQWLQDPDPNLQHAAVEAVRMLGVVDAVGDVSRILRETDDEGLAREAMQALRELAGDEALVDYAGCLDHSDYLVRDWAEQAIRPLLLDHAEAVRQLIATHPSKEVRNTLARFLDRAHAGFGAGQPGRPAGNVKLITAMLRSDDPQRQLDALGLARRDGTLMPQVIELLQSTDERVWSAAVTGVVGRGIPDLTLENAERLLGFAPALDRSVAAYCYVRYGRDALPLVWRAAFDWRDAETDNRRVFPRPAVGLIKLLIDQQVQGVDRELVSLVQAASSKHGYVQLLGLGTGTETARAIGEFLDHENGYYRQAAIRATHRRGLTQFADRLYAMARDAPDAEAVQRYRAGSVTNEERQRIQRTELTRENEALAAAKALIDFGDPRAWDAAARILEQSQLDWRAKSMIGARTVTKFGVLLAELKDRDRPAMTAKLREELDGDHRYWVVDTLTLAFAVEPVSRDTELLWEVASSPDAPERARVLAAVALSKIDDRRVVPQLLALAREWIASGQRGGAGWWSLYLEVGTAPGYPQYPNASLSLLTDSVAQPRDAALTIRHVDPVLALVRLGDATLVAEALDAIISDRREFNLNAYQALVALRGADAYALARDRLEQEAPDMLPAVSVMQVMTMPRFDFEVDREQANAWVTLNFDYSLIELPFIVRYRLTSQAEGIAALYAERRDEITAHQRSMFIHALCQLGDFRGLELAIDDPLLMWELGVYLPVERAGLFPNRGFRLNRIEDGLRLSQWYLEHRDQLVWDEAARVFTLTK